MLSGEDDLGLDDKVDQGRMEFDIRMGERNHMRIDYFKLNRFKEQPLPRSIIFGDFIFDEGTHFRSKLDWRVLTMTYTYSFFKSERFEGGLGLGIHLIEAQASGGEPGTLNREEASRSASSRRSPPTSHFAFPIAGPSPRADNSISASPEDFDGKMADYHADIQFRWRKNLAFGLGYTMLETNLVVFDTDQPLLFNLDTGGPELFFRVSFLTNF